MAERIQRFPLFLRPFGNNSADLGGGGKQLGGLAPDHLEEVWNTCFNLAMSFAKDRVQDVVLVLGPRMLKINKYDSAAEIYEAVGYFEKAIDAYIQCQKWDRAFECAQQVRPQEVQQLLVNKIQEQKKSMLIQGGKFNKIVESGDMSGLEMLYQRGQWEECLQLAEKQGQDVLITYVPEPSTIVALIGGLAGVAGFSIRRRRGC